MKFLKDSALILGEVKGKGDLATLAQQVINGNENYKDLNYIRLLFVQYSSPKAKRDSDSLVIAASTYKLSPRERDVYGFDIRVEVDARIWSTLEPDWKRRIMWHELNHIVVCRDEGTNDIMKDKDERVKLELRPHDIVLKTFEEELMKFGVSLEQLNLYKAMGKAVSLVEEGTLPKVVTPTVLIDGPEDEDEEDEAPIKNY